MRKLPDGEAKRREATRNHIKNENRKKEREARLFEERGYVTPTPEQKKQRILQQQRERRLAMMTPEQIARKEARRETQIAKLNVSPPKRRKCLKPRVIKQIKKVAVVKAEPVEVKLTKRDIDLGKCVKVVISPKLTVYVKQGTDIEKTRQKFSAC